MKKILILLPVFLITFLSSSHTQTRYANVDNYDYRSNNSNRNNDRYDDRSNRRRQNYRRNHSVYSRMSQRDRRTLRDLEKKLRKREDRAWEDGYLSQRDRRKLREIERDIDELLYKYTRRDRRQNNNRGRWSCR